MPSHTRCSVRLPSSHDDLLYCRAFLNFGKRRKGSFRSCAGRAKRLREKAWSFYANEFTVHTSAHGNLPMCSSGTDGLAVDGHLVCPPHVCKEFANVILFRYARMVIGCLCEQQSRPSGAARTNVRASTHRVISVNRSGTSARGGRPSLVY
jgi:hypothetical protein